MCRDVMLSYFLEFVVYCLFEHFDHLVWEGHRNECDGV